MKIVILVLLSITLTEKSERKLPLLINSGNVSDFDPDGGFFDPNDIFEGDPRYNPFDDPLFYGDEFKRIPGKFPGGGDGEENPFLRGGKIDPNDPRTSFDPNNLKKKPSNKPFIGDDQPFK